MMMRTTLAIVLAAMLHVAPATADDRESQPKKNSRLANASSRYLRSHAGNPVDWHPWGSAAFDRAKKAQKPIFLSIGYASCHWCHVMERESFENPEVARLLNENFVSILVDREEHPDVDATYVAFVEAMTGTAGWPANLVLTPDLRPIVGTTYLSSESLTRLLSLISERWRDDRDALLSSSDQVLAITRMAAQNTAGSEEALSEKVLARAFERILSSFDAEHGGFGPAPRFPQPATIQFLLRYAQAADNPRARDMAVEVLLALAGGGIRDQLAGGFHRYAVDEEWRVPHFEKMLYDQALLAVAYVEAWQATKDERLAGVARSTLDHALRELRLPGGGFASSLDSDSPPSDGAEPMEGAYYIWTLEELRTLLGPQAAELVAFHYGMKREGNVAPEYDPAGELKGKNVLAAAQPLTATAAHFEISPAAAEERLAAARRLMLDHRRRRPAPLHDDKVIAGWNGLMISALARAGAAFDEPRYVSAAVEAAAFLRSNLYEGSSKRLRRTWASVRPPAEAGATSIDALSEDYAYVVAGLLDLYESTFAVEWLDLAVVLQQRHDRDFWRAPDGRYAMGGNVPASLAGIANETDLALPSHNSMGAMNLLRLADLTDNRNQWREKAGALLRSFGSRLEDRPEELPQLLSALSRNLSTTRQIIIAGRPGAPDTNALLRIINGRFLPNRVLVLAPGGKAQAALAAYLPIVKQMRPIGSRATAYICEHYVCKMPTSDPRQVETILDSVR